MAENLNIGTMINGTEEMTDNGVIEKYCYDNDPANCEIYGGLYQWNEMMEYTSTPAVQGICPEGWYIPTDNDFTILTDFLGGESIAGGKLKEAGTTHWAPPNTGATNESGFTALPGGYRTISGYFNAMCAGALFWSSTESGTDDAWSRSLAHVSDNVTRFNYDKYRSFSMRCIKDNSKFVNLSVNDKDRDYEILDPKIAINEAVHFVFEGGNPAEAVYTLYIKGLEIGDEVAAYDGDKMVGVTRINSQKAFENELPVFSTLINGQGYKEGNPITFKVWSGNNVVSTDFTMEAIYDSYVSDVYPDEDGKYSIVNITKEASNEWDEIIVFPNPATDLINIVSSKEIKSISVFNYVGQVVYYGNETQINTSNFESGVYIVRIETRNRIVTHKVTIN